MKCLTLSRRKRLLSWVMASLISSLWDVSWELLAPNENPPYLCRSQSFEYVPRTQQRGTWFNIDPPITSRWNVSDNVPELVDPNLVLQAETDDLFYIYNEITDNTMNQEWKQTNVSGLLPFANDLRVGFNQIVRDVSASQILKGVCVADFHL